MTLMILGAWAASFAAVAFASQRGATITRASAVLLPWATVPLVLAAPAGATHLPWLSRADLVLTLTVDGPGRLMALLAAFVTSVAALLTPAEQPRDAGRFLALVLGGFAATGTFLAGDLLTFFGFYELMLAPMFILVAGYGEGSARGTAAARMFVATQLGGLLFLVGAIGIAARAQTTTGSLTFEVARLAGHVTPDATTTALIALMVGGLLVKAPLVPLHGWLPDAYGAAPTGAVAQFSGLLSKTALVALVRLVAPLEPATFQSLAPVVTSVAAAGGLYAGLLAFSQSQPRALAAWVSVSHLAVVVLGIFGGSTVATTGALLLMLAHGISSPGLFALAEAIAVRGPSGLGASAPRLAGFGLVVLFAAAGVPGLANFAGEFAVLAGTWRTFPFAVTVAQATVVLATLYATSLFARACAGPARDGVRDLDSRELGAFALVTVWLLMLGVAPSLATDVLAPVAAPAPIGDAP
ncbi:MAG: NADH-ubiquinone oxidoreductase subunit NuoM [Pseudomonadota bacterium]|jgi:NADH-quinone oxidoreductase subunit M